METSRAEGLAYRVVVAIAERENTTPTGLPPLGNAVDIEALERFLDSTTRDSKAEFQYLGWEIRVRSDGSFTITKHQYE